MILVWLALAAVVVSAAAGVLLLVLDPDAGSTTEAALGITAAISGIATGVLAIAAFIYAQAKNLWKFAPVAVRVVLWVFIGVGIAITLWNLISQPFNT
jgi:hypothetical protein